MKNRRYLFTAVLCAVLFLAVLTSCGKKKPAETKHVHAWNDGETTNLTPCKQETVYTCTACGETRSETTEKDHVWSTGLRLVTLPTETSNGERVRVCTLCGKIGGTVPMTNADYTSQWNMQKEKAGSFLISEFGGEKVTSSFTKRYDAPPKTPVAEHPRVLINKSDLAGIREALKEDRNAVAAAKFYNDVLTPPDGKLGEAVKHEKGTYKYLTNCTYNYDDEMLKNIQALALDYQLTGNKISGYEAIFAIKNYIITLKIVDVTSDPERQYGAVMYTAACVYDWCYDLLTDADKLQIVSGIEHKIVSGNHMEMSFPPSGQTAVAGHGCEYQLMRDYLSFAIAIYDEYPGWWDFIAGRFYQEYVDARNEFYAGGMVSQGISLYVRVRFASDLFSAWLLKAGVGEMPYNVDNMKQVMRSIYAYELPNGNGFAMGDSHETKIDGDFINYGLPAMMASYLFGDETARAQLESRPCCYTKFFDEDQDCFEYGSVSEYLICSSTGVKAASDVHKDIDLILYNGGWLGQIIARNNWGVGQATVLMKIGVKTAGNHDHRDQGQFQIWYKGMLAGDTGVYDSYNSDHRKQYHRETIAHNSLLINDKGQTKIGGDEMSAAQFKEDGWTKTGEVIGVQYAYADLKRTQPLYAYIAGDITPSYYDKDSEGKTTGSSSLVSEVSRRMLVVYDTKNADVPMYFFVFDNVTAKKSPYKKTFLLHTRTEPTVVGNTVTEVNGEGKLVLQSVFGGDKITTIGGENNNYNVNGEQIAANPDATSREDGFWGRVEIVTNTGNATDQLLNVMYVCDADKNPNLIATGFSNDTVKGAVIGNTAAVFVTSAATIAKRASSAFSFTAAGAGELTYYVSGVKAGNWTVSAGGTTQTATATFDGGLLVFTAPAGTVTLTPQ